MKIISKVDFEKKTEFYTNTGHTILEAIEFVCNDEGIEPEDAKKYLTKDLIKRVQVCAEDLNLIEKTEKRLDI